MQRASLLISLIIATAVTGCSTVQHQVEPSTHNVRQTCTNYTMAGAKHVECIGRYVAY